LYAQKDEIEAEFGGHLEWQRLDDKRASHITKRFPDRRLTSPEEEWPELQDTMIDAMIRFEKALRPRLQKTSA